ncbi:MAG: hypothetical protein U0900_19590 [Myxococcota bacterium]
MERADVDGAAGFVAGELDAIVAEEMLGRATALEIGPQAPQIFLERAGRPLPRVVDEIGREDLLEQPPVARVERGRIAGEQGEDLEVVAGRFQRGILPT